MNSGIYKIVNSSNSKIYVGSSYDISYRWKKHLERLTKGKHHSIHLQRAWTNQNGQGFSIEVIEHCPLTSLLEREQFYLDTLKPEYNIAISVQSSLGIKRREETKEKLRLLNTGKTHSLETRQKQSAALTGRSKNFSEEGRRSISDSKKGSNNPIFKVGWNTQIEAMKAANTGKVRDKSINAKISAKRSKSISQFNLDGSFVKDWTSAKQVENILGWHNSPINKVCNHKKKTYKGYIWRFKT